MVWKTFHPPGLQGPELHGPVRHLVVAHVLLEGVRLQVGHRVRAGRGPHGQGSPTESTKQRLWNLFLFSYITAGVYQRGICCQDSGEQKVWRIPVRIFCTFSLDSCWSAWPLWEDQYTSATFCISSFKNSVQFVSQLTSSISFSSSRGNKMLKRFLKLQFIIRLNTVDSIGSSPDLNRFCSRDSDSIMVVFGSWTWDSRLRGICFDLFLQQVMVKGILRILFYIWNLEILGYSHF